jgi:hypothetical protein
MANVASGRLVKTRDTGIPAAGPVAGGLLCLLTDLAGERLLAAAMDLLRVLFR